MPRVIHNKFAMKIEIKRANNIIFKTETLIDTTSSGNISYFEPTNGLKEFITRKGRNNDIG